MIDGPKALICQIACGYLQITIGYHNEFSTFCSLISTIQNLMATWISEKFQICIKGLLKASSFGN